MAAVRDKRWRAVHGAICEFACWLKVTMNNRSEDLGKATIGGERMAPTSLGGCGTGIGAALFGERAAPIPHVPGAKEN
jgi:hypothetical protein